MKLIFLGGVVLFIGSIILLVKNYKNIQVEQKGIVVKMVIKKIPSSCTGNKINHYMTLNYNEKSYIKRIGTKFCNEHKIGDLIDIKFLEGFSIVLFPTESVRSDLFALCLIGILGLFISVFQLKKITK